MVLSKAEVSWFGDTMRFVDPAAYSVRLSGLLQVPTTDTYTLELQGVGKSCLLLDGNLLIDNWDGDGQSDVTLDLQESRNYELIIENRNDFITQWRGVRLGCALPLPDDPIH